MVNESPPPDLHAFTVWLARQLRVPSESASGSRYADLLKAARAARDETLLARLSIGGGQTAPVPIGRIEILQLLAAADKSESVRPPELTTARGFRVTLSYDEGAAPELSSICVLVQCPPELIKVVQGETVFLWNGAERFELGQFDPDGKAIGMLPAGIEISLSDFAVGKVKLEGPPPAAGEP